MQMREKVKSRNTVFFQWFGAPEGRKVGSLKRRVRSHLARWEMKNCTPLWREAHFEVKIYKTHQLRTTFGSWDVEKVHACGAKHILKSKCTKNTRCGPLLAVEMSKKCTPLWREAHFENKMLLDDGWPESVEEQGLLLLVWRHHIAKQYIKDVLEAVEKRSIKTI